MTHARTATAGILAGLALFLKAAPAAAFEPGKGFEILKEVRALVVAGEVEEARARFAEALDEWRLDLGARRPRTAVTLPMALQTLSMQIEGPADAAILELFDLQPADRAYLEARRRPGWEAFEAVARLDPKHPPARRALATMAADLGRWKEARWRFETLVSEFPRDADARHRFAFAAWNNGEEDLALEQWAAAVEATPGHADSWYGIGTAWLGKGLWESAEKALTKAVDLDPLNWRAREALIQAHVGLGRFAKAQADRDVLRRLSPKLPRVGDRIVVAVLPREGGALLVREGLQESAGWAFRAERFSQAPPGGKPIHVTELRRAGDGFELGDVADDGTFSAKKTLPAGSDLERFLEEVKR